MIFNLGVTSTAQNLYLTMDRQYHMNHKFKVRQMLFILILLQPTFFV